jgi:hypothetical protein
MQMSGTCVQHNMPSLSCGKSSFQRRVHFSNWVHQLHQWQISKRNRPGIMRAVYRWALLISRSS